MENSCSFEIVLPDGQSVYVDNVEPIRTADEIAKAIAKKASLAIPSGHVPQLYMLSSGEALTGTAGNLAQLFASGSKIGLRVVNVISVPDVMPQQVSISDPSQQTFVGKRRNPCAPLFLPLITLGIYTLVWIYKLFNEARLYANKRNKTKITSGGAAVGFLFIPVFNIVWGIMLSFKIPGLVTRMRQADGVNKDQRGSTGALGFLTLIPIIGGILWVILTQKAINSFWKEAHRKSGFSSVIHDASRPGTGYRTLFVILLVFLIAGAIAGVVLYQQGQLPLPFETEYGFVWKTHQQMERERLEKVKAQIEREQLGKQKAQKEAEKKEKVSSFLAKANFFSKNQEYRKCLDIIPEILALEPDNLKAQNLAEHARQQLQVKIEAERRKQEYDKWFNKAQVSEREGNLSEAIEFYEKAQGYTNESLRSKIKLLNRQIAEKEKQEQFARLFTQAKAKDNIRTGKEALRLVEEALALRPSDTEALALKRKLKAYINLKPGDAITNSIGMKLVWIPPGEFMMGSLPDECPKYYRYDGPKHMVRLTRYFYLGATEVTRSQFATFVRETGYKTYAENQGWAIALRQEYAEARGHSVVIWARVDGTSWRNPGFAQNNYHPVICVTHDDASAFCNWLSRKTGKHYRLPTEAEWEYACRAGTNTPFNTGLAINTNQANYNGDYSYNAESGHNGCTRAVGTFAPNAWGLYDMHGNVSELCKDWSYNYPSGSVEDPIGVYTGDTTSRMMRGGSWDSPAESCRSASRGFFSPNEPVGNVGFRVIQDLN